MRNIIRSFILGATLLLTAAGNMAIAQTVSSEARPVLDRAIQFLGGIDSIRALKDVEGHMQQTVISPKGNVEIQVHSIIVYPGTIRQEYKAYFGEKSTSVVTFFDGTNGWVVQDGKLININENQKRVTRQELSQELPNLLGLAGGPTVTYEGKSGGNDVLAFVLGDLSVRLHIDSTGQVVKLARRTSGDIEVTFSDYRKVGGVEMAYKTSVTRNGQRYSDAKITEATANTNPSLENLAQKPGGQAAGGNLASVVPLKLPSTYTNAQSPADQLQLNTDSTFTLQEGGQPYRGTFMANGGTIELTISGTGTKTTLSRQGNDLADSIGQMWRLREQSAGAPGGTVLHNEDIIKLATVGIDDATIIAKINSSKCQFDTSTDALIQLKKEGGVSASVLKAMVGSGK